MSNFESALSEMPLVAILRGLHIENAIEVSDILIEAGFRIIEVPLNSPDALSSISLISKRHGHSAIIGAGTVLTEDEVDAVALAGGQIVVAPNINSKVGTAAISRGLTWCPGIMSPTEAFLALDLGAKILKLFPAELVPPVAVSAMRAVLPTGTKTVAVGGISTENMLEYFSAGANGIGLGSSLFKPSYKSNEIRQRAEELIRVKKDME